MQLNLTKHVILATFEELGLSLEILKGIKMMGFETPTDIQSEAIPMLLEDDTDFIGLAQTGTGKTAAFGLPLLDHIDPDENYTQALVLAPTRELGQQIAGQLEMYSKYMKRVNVLPVYGGAAITNQIKALRKTQHVIIATPGRLIDLIKRKAVKLENLKMLVLDEADEMLNMGFKDELDTILSYTPDEKNTWLFSATMPSFIKKIVKRYMDNPKEVKIDAKNQVNTNIDHQFAIMRASNKTEALMRFIDLNLDMRGVVFCRTRRDTQTLAEKLLNNNYKADALHGDLSQKQRDHVMKRFKDNKLQMLIATDVAARGIDVNDLTHVFHFALPDDDAYYTHRSGRTARAGKKGISMAFINSRETGRINRLGRSLNIEFTKVEIPSSESIADIRIEQWAGQILETKTKGVLDPQLLGKVNEMFDSLNKEELIAKILMRHLEVLNIGSAKDLNESEDRSGGYDRGRGRKRDSRGRGGHGGRGGNRKSSGRGGDRRSSGRNNDRRSSSRNSDEKKSGPERRKAKKHRKGPGDSSRSEDSSFKYKRNKKKR